MVGVLMMRLSEGLLSYIDCCDAMIDVERAINGFIATNYLIRLLCCAVALITAQQLSSVNTQKIALQSPLLLAS